MDTDIISVMKDGMPQFSKGNKALAHYIIENTDAAAFMTAAELGEHAGVSESTVVRFAMKLGFKGFPQFQEELGRVIRGRLNRMQTIDISDSSLTHPGILDYVMKGDACKIQDTLGNLDVKAFDVAVDTIAGARKIYVMGLRSSAALAQFLGFYLKMIVDDVEIIGTNSSGEIFEQMIDISSDDVFIGISFPRYSMRTLKAMEFANNCNARVIAITDNIHSPMNLYSSCNLFARTDMAGIVDSLAAPLSLINALIVALCIRNSRKVLGKLEKLGTVWEDYRITNNDEINYLDEELIQDLRKLK